MKIKLHKKYSNKINESIMELKKVKPLFESTIDPGLINLDSYTQAFQDKGATDAILAEFKISKSLFEYLTLKKVPSNYDALMTVTNMPKKFFNINLSYDNKPEETIKKADDYAFKYFTGIKFKISDLTDIKPKNETIDYTNLDSLMILNEGPSDHGSFLFGGDFIGDHRMNNQDLQNQHTEDKQKAVDASISNGSKKMKSVTTAIDNYIDDVASSLKVCIEEFSPNGAAALKDFDKAVNTLKSGAVNGEKITEYIKHLDQNHRELENAKLERLQNEKDSLEIILQLMGLVLAKVKKDEAFRNKCTTDVILKLLKSKKRIEFDNILDKAGLTLDESLTHNDNNVLNEIALNEADESTSEKFLDIDEIYDGAYTILKNALDPIFETARDEIKSVKKARELMETLLKKRSEEINNRIGAICRIGGNSKDIPGLSQLARTFLNSHPLRAEGLKNIWANHEIDLQNRMENRLNSLKSGEIMSYAEAFITNQIPRIIAMMLAYKTIARVLEVKSAHMSAAGVKKVNEIKGDALDATNDLVNSILMSLYIGGPNITSPAGTDLYIYDASANTINARYTYNTAAQFDLNGKLGLFVNNIGQNIGLTNTQTFVNYVNALNININNPEYTAKIILDFVEECKNERLFVNNPNKLTEYLEIPQDSLDKVTNYKTLLESVKIGDITDNKQIEGMKKLLAIAYKKGKEISSINASTLEGEIDRDKLAIVNGFDLAKLFTVDGSKEIVSQIYENAREMQLTDNFTDVKDLVSVINIMTSLVNLITNKELLEAAINKQDDSLLAAFFEYINSSDLELIKTGITSMSGGSKNIPADTSIGTITQYLENPDSIISDYRNIEDNKHEIKVEVPNELNAKLLKSKFDEVYGINFSDQNLIKIAEDYINNSPEVDNKKIEKYNDLKKDLSTLMKMLVDILIVKANNAQEKTSLEDIKKYVNDAYKSDEWTFGSKDGEKSSIRDFIKRYVEAGTELNGLKNTYKEGDAKKALDAAWKLKQDADTEFEKSLTNFDKVSEETNNLIKTRINKKLGTGFIGFLTQLFENELSDKDTNSTKEVIEYLKKIGISEKNAYEYLSKLFEWLSINGDITLTKYIKPFIENCMYEPEELGEATLENSNESSENTEKELTSESLYYGNQKYVFENDTLTNVLNEESKTIGLILTSIFELIKKGGDAGKKLFNKLVGNDSSKDEETNDNESNNKSVLDPKTAQANAELADNVLAKMSEINVVSSETEYLKTIQLQSKSLEQLAKQNVLLTKLLIKLNGQNSTNTASAQSDELVDTVANGDNKMDGGLVQVPAGASANNKEK